MGMSQMCTGAGHDDSKWAKPMTAALSTRILLSKIRVESAAFMGLAHLESTCVVDMWIKLYKQNTTQ